MAGDLTVDTKGTAIARPLRVLVPLIKDDLKEGDAAAERAGLPHYRAAGEKMLEAKPQLSGEFEAWVRRNFKISSTQARRYMALARTTEDRNFNRQPVTLTEAIGEQPRDVRRAKWHAPVAEIVSKAQINAVRWAQANLNRVEEREAQRKLGLQLIEIGYKALASKLHPDKVGGSRDAMTRLNTVRDRLKQSA